MGPSGGVHERHNDVVVAVEEEGEGAQVLAVVALEALADIEELVHNSVRASLTPSALVCLVVAVQAC